MRKISSFIAGAFFGAIIGSVVAILMTPASGEELMSRARDRVDSLSADMEAAYKARKSQLEKELEDLRAAEEA